MNMCPAIIVAAAAALAAPASASSTPASRAEPQRPLLGEPAWIAESPLRVRAAAADERLLPGALPLALDAGALRALRDAEGRTLVMGFELPDGPAVDLDLQRVNPFAEGARVVLMQGGVEHDLPLPEVAIFRGTVAGDPESRVFLSMQEGVVNGYVRFDAGTYVIAPRPGEPGSAAIYETQALLNAPIGAGEAPPQACLTAPGDTTWDPAVAHLPPVALRSTPPCREMLVAIETDTEYNADFGYNTTLASGYAATLLAAVSEIYETDVNIALKLSFVRLWAPGETDPYTTNSASTTLSQFANNFNQQPRDLSHLFSGKNFNDAGGIAYLGGLCNTLGFGVSGYLNYSFPYPLADHRSSNWDPIVVAHEIGHNAGTGHTHDSYSPRIDECGNGDCSSAFGGTIMSYCHTCPGGVSNIVLNFHPRVVTQILSYVGSRSCDYTRAVSAIAQQPASEAVLLGEPAIFSVTLDAPTGNETFQWYRNGTIVPGATGPVLTIPQTTFASAGDYTCRVDLDCGFDISDPATLAVTGIDCDENGFDDSLDIAAARAIDCNANGIPDSCDVATTFADSSGDLSPIGSGSPQSHAFAGLPAAAGPVEIHFDVSGDFSSATETLAVTINGQSFGSLFVSGAGDCPRTPDRETIVLTPAEFATLAPTGAMQVDMVATASVSANLCFPAASTARVTVEYNINSTLDTDGDGIPDSCQSACVADTTTTGTTNGTPDGVVDISDFSFYLTLWASADPAADLTTTGSTNGTPDGAVDVSDYSYYLTLWAAGCP